VDEGTKMEKEFRDNEVRYSRGDDFLSEGLEPDTQGGISSPTWRGLLIAVIAAIVLSVTATIMLGGAFVYGRGGTAAGCGAGSGCCAPGTER
jgi:hypothetical protein